MSAEVVAEDSVADLKAGPVGDSAASKEPPLQQAGLAQQRAGAAPHRTLLASGKRGSPRKIGRPLDLDVKRAGHAFADELVEQRGVTTRSLLDADAVIRLVRRVLQKPGAQRSSQRVAALVGVQREVDHSCSRVGDPGNAGVRDDLCAISQLDVCGRARQQTADEVER